MSLIPMPRLWLPDYPLARLFVYASGTITKQNSFSDKLLTTAHTNPVVSDLSGLFPTIHLDPALAYKFVLAAAGTDDPPSANLWSVDEYSVTSPGALATTAATVSTSVAATDGDDILILADASLGSIVIALYTAVGNTGKKVRVVKTDATNNTVTIDPASTQTVDGATTVVLTSQYQGRNMASDGSNWVSFGRAAPFGRVTAMTTSGSVAATDGEQLLVVADATAGSVTVSLSTAVGKKGRRIVIKRTDAVSGNSVIVDPAGTETIDGGTTYTLNAQYSFIEVESDGTNWHVVASSVREITATVAISGGVLTFNLAAASVFLVTLNANVTGVAVGGAPPSGGIGAGTVIATADGTPRSWAMSGTHKTPGGIAITPTSTNGKKDVYTFFTPDAGTTVYWFVSGQNF